jgi:hypothetical protein
MNLSPDLLKAQFVSGRMCARSTCHGSTNFGTQLSACLRAAPAMLAAAVQLATWHDGTLRWDGQALLYCNMLLYVLTTGMI